MRLIVFLILTFSVQSFAQNAGCVFLEGLGLPCNTNNENCQTCKDQYTEEQMNSACRETLPLNNPEGCTRVSCGKKCCSKCSDFDPSDYYTCQDLPTACDDNGQVVSCGKGTKVPTCEDAYCTSLGNNRCGEFTCTPCAIRCEGKIPKRTCYSWSTDYAENGTCSCQNTSSCQGSPTGASECGTSSSPCRGSSANSCTGSSNRCWTCSFSPGVVTPLCSRTGNSACYQNPTQVEVCPTFSFDSNSYTNSCPTGFTDSPTNPPGTLCSALPPAECTTNSQCSCN